MQELKVEFHQLIKNHFSDDASLLLYPQGVITPPPKPCDHSTTTNDERDTPRRRLFSSENPSQSQGGSGWVRHRIILRDEDHSDSDQSDVETVTSQLRVREKVDLSQDKGHQGVQSIKGQGEQGNGGQRVQSIKSQEEHSNGGQSIKGQGEQHNEGQRVQSNNGRDVSENQGVRCRAVQDDKSYRQVIIDASVVPVIDSASDDECSTESDELPSFREQLFSDTKHPW